jgi:hypothetical protein
MMAYKPSLEDLSESSSYTPSLEDLDDEPKSASQAILSQIEESQQAQPQQQRTPQMQEEFSNPTMWPGFSDLPKEEQLRRIAYSQFDPANEASGGRYVPGGTYESDPARMMASVLPTLAVPELRAGWPVVRGLANALTRVGAGTLGNIAYQAPNIKSKEDLGNVAIQSGALNALLEGATLPLRGAARLAEIFNPLKYTANKAAQIKNEFTASKAVTDEMYRPINEEYNDFPVTLTPKNYLKDAGVTKNQLYPDAKIIYDDFMKEPNFENLHKLQSKLGEDWARISQHPTTSEKAQLFSQMRDKLKGKVQNFLSRDENALNQYNAASQYASNNYFPYLATPTLRKIAKGKMDVTPNSLARSIKIGTEKTVGKEQSNLIPEGHPLRNHLSDLEKKISQGRALQVAIPALTGAAVGEYTNPGLTGVLGGASTGLGLGGVGAIASKLGGTTVTGMLQEPWIRNWIKRLAPVYYGGGRTGIGIAQENR